MNGEKHLNMLAEVMPPEVLAKVRAEIENGRARDVLGATASPRESDTGAAPVSGVLEGVAGLRTLLPGPHT